MHELTVLTSGHNTPPASSILKENGFSPPGFRTSIWPTFNRLSSPSSATVTAIASGIERKAHNGGMQPSSTSSLGMEQVGGVTFACVGKGSGPTYRIWSGDPPLVMLATTQQASFCTLKESSCRIWITRGTRWASRTLCSGEKEEINSKALSFSHTLTHCTVEPLYKRHPKLRTPL